MISPRSPEYIPTTEGHIKTHETVHYAHATVPEPRRSTQDTQETHPTTHPTTTSGPSFGHFGRPFSQEVNQGLETGEEDATPIIIIQGGKGPAYGFGLDLGGLGLDGLGGMGDYIHDHDVLPPHDKMSAYVETVEDEEEVPERNRSPGVASHRRQHGHSSEVPHTFDQVVQEHARQPSAKGSDASVQGSAVSQAPMRDQNQNDLRSRSRPAMARPMSTYTNMTTMSLVQQLVSDSRFHDEALCQILAAAENQHLGEAAKKTLRRAAKERVLALMQDDIQPSVSFR